MVAAPPYLVLGSIGLRLTIETRRKSSPDVTSPSRPIPTDWAVEQGGGKSTPSSPRLRVGVILTDPEPVREALGFSYSDSFQLNQLRLWEWEAVQVKYQGSRGHSDLDSTLVCISL